MKSFFGIIMVMIIIFSLVLFAHGELIVPAGKISLWNGKDFSGWKMVLKKKETDPLKVWSVKEGVILCTGKPSGYIRTEKDYADYKLHVEWRWVITSSQEEPPKRKKKRPKKKNSGVLLHMKEPDEVWPRSIECQLMNKNAGDFYVIGGTEFKEHLEAVKKFHEEQKNKKKGPSRRTIKKEESSEKSLGEWNEYDIICKGNTITVYVNEVLQNTATETTVSSGKIALQSEGSAIEFRKIYIEPLD